MDRKKENENKKRLIRAAVSLTMVLVLSLTVFAWFTNEKKLDTITKVNAPTMLQIGAGHTEDSKYIDLGEINAEEGNSKDYVFCVYSDKTSGSYRLQLAHTTNIPFTYTIYKATESESATGDVTYTTHDENSTIYSYAKGDALSGNYLNQDADTKIANNTKHLNTYGEYDSQYVQKNAEPLYWQSESITPNEILNANNLKFVDYYILKLNWNNGEVTNNKETDMVYITASMTSTTQGN